MFKSEGLEVLGLRMEANEKHRKSDATYFFSGPFQGAWGSGNLGFRCWGENNGESTNGQCKGNWGFIGIMLVAFGGMEMAWKLQYSS